MGMFDYLKLILQKREKSECVSWSPRGIIPQLGMKPQVHLRHNHVTVREFDKVETGLQLPWSETRYPKFKLQTSSSRVHTYASFPLNLILSNIHFAFFSTYDCLKHMERNDLIQKLPSFTDFLERLYFHLMASFAAFV